jgi:hypothetical protein
MKKVIAFLLISVVFLVFCVAYKCYSEEFNIQDLSGGIQDNVDSTLIGDTNVQDALNVYFDEEGMAKKREGIAQLTSTAIGDGQPVKKLFEYRKSNGTSYLIAASSNTIYYSQTGAAFTAIENGFTTTYPMSFAVFMDTLNYCNGTENLRAWDGNSAWEQTSSYQFKFLASWKNRLWGAGDTGEPSALRSCGFQAPQDWTIPTASLAVSTNPVLFDINSQDGQKIVGLFLSPNGNLGVLKEKSVWEIWGNDRDDFIPKLVIPDIGCVDGGSVVYRQGIVYWLSSKGIIAYNGKSMEKVSSNIDGTIDLIQQLSFGGGSFFKNSQGDWQTYSTTSSISTTDIPGSINLNIIDSDDSTVYSGCFDLVKDTATKRIYIAKSGGNPSFIVYYPSGTWGTLDLNINNSVTSFSGLYSSKNFLKLNGDKLYLAYLYPTASNTYNVYLSSTDKNTISWSNTLIGASGNSTLDTYSYWTSVDFSTMSVPYVMWSSGTTSAHLNISSYTSASTSWSTTISTTIAGDTTESKNKINSASMVINDKLNVGYSYRYPDTSYDVYSKLYYSSSTVNNTLSWSDILLSSNVVTGIDQSSSDTGIGMLSAGTAQSFYLATNMYINKFSGYFYSASPPPYNTVVTVQICSDNSNSPGTVLGTGSNITITATGFVWYDSTFATPVSLLSNTKYWIKLTPDDDSSDWRLNTTSVITGNLARNEGSWTQYGDDDAAFKIYCDDVSLNQDLGVYYSVDVTTDNAGYPHVVAFDRNAGYLKHHYWSGTAWTSENIGSALGSVTYDYLSCNIEIDKSSTTFILKSDGNTSGTLTLYRKYNGGSWTTSTIDNTRINGENSLSSGFNITKDNDYPIAAWVRASDNYLYLQREATGYYESEVFDTGITDPNWGLFTVESTITDYTSSHYVRTSSSSVDVSTVAWQAITSNSVPTGTMKRYIQYKVTFSTPTLVPTTITSLGLNAMDQQYSSSAGNTPLWALEYQDRIWFGVSISSTTILDKFLVNDTNNAWTKFGSQLNFNSMVNYGGYPYLGDNVGHVYKFGIGNSDDSNPIESYFITKDYLLGNAVQDKSLLSLFNSYNKSGSWDVTLDYYLDKNTSYNETFDISQTGSNNLLTYKFPLTKQTRFKSVNFKVYNNDADEPFELLNIFGIFQRYPLE